MEVIELTPSKITVTITDAAILSFARKCAEYGSDGVRISPEAQARITAYANEKFHKEDIAEHARRTLAMFNEMASTAVLKIITSSDDNVPPLKDADVEDTDVDTDTHDEIIDDTPLTSVLTTKKGTRESRISPWKCDVLDCDQPPYTEHTLFVSHMQNHHHIRIAIIPELKNSLRSARFYQAKKI